MGLEDFRYLLGKTIEEAEELHHNLRVVQADEEIMPGAANIDQSRLNVRTQNGKISEIVRRG